MWTQQRAICSLKAQGPAWEAGWEETWGDCLKTPRNFPDVDLCSDPEWVPVGIPGGPEADVRITSAPWKAWWLYGFLKLTFSSGHDGAQERVC